MAGAGGDGCYDLSIMYSPRDGTEWSEFLQDSFRQQTLQQNDESDIMMYFESIEQLPLHHSGMTAIKNSRCQFLLVSPEFTELLSDPAIKDLIPRPQQVVVLLCGVENEDLMTFVGDIPGYEQWTVMSTNDGVPDVIHRTLKVIDSFTPEQDDSPYMPMTPGKPQGEAAVDDTYLTMHSSGPSAKDSDLEEDTYLNMAQSRDSTENLYLDMTGAGETHDTEEDTYLSMMQSSDSYGEDVYEDMDPKASAAGQVEDTYLTMTVRTPDSGTDDGTSRPPLRPPKPAQKSKPEKVTMSKELQLVQPSRITSGSGERVVMIFKSALPEVGSYSVEFKGEKQTSVVTATKENQYTLVLKAPDHPPEKTKATVKGDSKFLGSMTMLFVSKISRLEEVLLDVTNPIKFMLQSLGAKDMTTLDKILRDTFKKHMPPKGLGVFGIDQESEEEYASHPEEFPTLLHFVAKYGLKDMCASLLHCPGALNACSITNRDNDFPHNIAEKNGHMDLKKYIEDRIELGALLEEEMGSGYVDMDKDLYERMARIDPATYGYMAMGYYNAHSYNKEGGYYNIFQRQRSDSVEEQPDYDHPFPVAIPDVDVYGEYSPGYIKGFLHAEQREVQEEDPEIYDDPDKSEPALHSATPRPFSGMRGTSITKERHSLKQQRVVQSPTEKRRSQTLPIGATLDLSSATEGASPSSGQEDLAMYTPGQQELIQLQKAFKEGVYTADEAVIIFKEWQMRERDRVMSFNEQQKELSNLRASVQRRRGNQKGQPEVGPPVPKHGKDEGVYGRVLHKIRRSTKDQGHQESEAMSRQPRKAAGRPPSYKRGERGNRESTLSNSSSSSGGSRHSVMSTASLDSGMDVPPVEDIPEDVPPPIPLHIPKRTRPLSGRFDPNKFDEDFRNKPVPPPPPGKRPLPKEPKLQPDRPPPRPPPAAKPKPSLTSRRTEPNMSQSVPPPSAPRPSLPTSAGMTEVTLELNQLLRRQRAKSPDDEESISPRASPHTQSPKPGRKPGPPPRPARGSNPQPPPRPPKP